MASTSTFELLAHCFAGDEPSDDLLRSALEDDSGRAFFRVVVERLGDSFEPRLCDVYASLFARVIELAHPELKASETVRRYQRVRSIRRCELEPKRVYVLSRVTLGADVAVTSVVLDAAKKRFPKAELYFAGPRKNWELFAADTRIRHHDLAYPRAGSVADRLHTWPVFNEQDTIVIDPDSRLTQLGLLPVCAEQNYFFFESRAFGGERDASLVQLTREWVQETFGVQDARSWVAPQAGSVRGDITVSFGVGDNADKRIVDPFEERLLKALSQTNKSVVVDEGAGPEEPARIQRLCQLVPGISSWSGAYAPFAYAISQAKLYVGYDSVGQHVAAASGTPLVTVFAGHTGERMFQRWRPHGPGSIRVIKVENSEPPEEVLKRTLQNLTL